MSSPFRILLAALIAALCAAAPARAELAFPVNDAAGVFDQPSVAMSGATAHVAFTGAAGAGGPFRIYYAAVNGAADFSNTALARASVIITPPSIVDNTDLGGNDPYYDARHPAIALRSATEAVIFFQARPSGPSDPYALYRARVRLDNNAVVEQRVNRVSGIPGGEIQDVSFALVGADNTATARVAYSTRIAPTDPFDISFARVGLDNAEAAPPVAVTTVLTYPLARGFRPVPSLKLDGLYRAHIAWAATDDSGTTSGPVYYALVKETGGVDNMVIAPTPIMTREFMRYSFPSVLVLGTSSILVFAGDEVDGNLAYVVMNPDAARQDGRPAWDNLSVNGTFLTVPPGEAILPDEFSLFRPEMIYEASSARIFMTGYGTAGCTFQAVKLNAAAATVDRVSDPVQFGLTEPPASLAGDYTKAAFGFPGGKVVAFWSGAVGTSGDRNLDVTTVPTVAAWVETSESGCAVAPRPGGPAAGTIPGALLPLLTAAALAGRRIAVKRRRRAAPPEPPDGVRPGRRSVGR